MIAAELADWLRSQEVKDTVSYDRIIGCPHEEGIDYPIGRTCPQCPLWAGIDRFTHEPIPTSVARLSADRVLIVRVDRTSPYIVTVARRPLGSGRGEGPLRQSPRGVLNLMSGAQVRNR